MYLKKWEDTGLLTCFNNHVVSKEKVATLLEQQKNYNDTLSDVDSDVTTHRFLAMFRRMSIPVIVRILHQLKTPRLINFEPVANAESTVPKHILKTILPDPKHYLIIDDGSLQIEAEMATLIAQQLALEIDLNVISEIRNNAGLVSYVDPTDPNTNFLHRFYEILKEIKNSTGFIPNWVVASSEVVEYLPEVAVDFLPNEDAQTIALGIRYCGELVWQNDIKQKLFENTFAHEHEMLLGCHGQKLGSTFEPKVLIQPMLKRNQKIRKARLRSEFKTTWEKGSRSFYARINVKAPEIDID